MKKPFGNFSKDYRDSKFKIISESIEYYFKIAYVDLIPCKVAISKTMTKYKLSRPTFFRHKKLYNAYLKTIK